MSIAAAFFISGPSSVTQFKVLGKGGSFYLQKTFFSSGFLSQPRPSDLFLKSCSYGYKRKSIPRPIRPFSPVMEWQDCRSEIEVDVPCSVAYNCYSDRESIPKWMPFISAVKILEDKPHLSRWSLKYEIFGRDVELSWLARNMQPTPNQKIHWRSLEGLPNRGAVRFFPRGSSSCRIELTISYEVPSILTPVASALKPFMEGLLLRSLEQFVTFAKDQQGNISKL